MLPLLHVAKVNKGLLSPLPENQDPGNEVATTDSNIVPRPQLVEELISILTPHSGLCHYATPYYHSAKRGQGLFNN
jgi:hypothetical protein